MQHLARPKRGPNLAPCHPEDPSLGLDVLRGHRGAPKRPNRSALGVLNRHGLRVAFRRPQSGAGRMGDGRLASNCRCMRTRGTRLIVDPGKGGFQESDPGRHCETDVQAPSLTRDWPSRTLGAAQQLPPATASRRRCLIKITSASFALLDLEQNPASI